MKILTSDFENKQQKRQIGVLSSTQKYLTCFEPGLKCFYKIFRFRLTTVCFKAVPILLPRWQQQKAW